MSEAVVILLLSTVAKNIVNVVKMLADAAQRVDAVWLLLTGVAGGGMIYFSGVEINVFKFMGVNTTPGISVFNGVLIGLFGQDLYKVMKLVQQKTPKTRPQ